ncbi:hypothetical protein AcW1_009487 [Taiwanofungus camphoratus]|nr:hypothetical protein AcV5_002609 [Antrodia cinnamomea]KAI0918787.1 hypothetical protein AcV7_006920 [Antrodia cinnamomea]KAI0947826.1 hypothetical protein AcW1_009487 [Antrodia cinnamomea]
MPAKGGSRGAATGSSKTTPADAARIQSTQAKGGNDSSKGSFPARAQAAAARNSNAGAAGAGAKAGGKGAKVV